jgi:hypothetical protein
MDDLTYYFKEILPNFVTPFHKGKIARGAKLDSNISQFMPQRQFEIKKRFHIDMTFADIEEHIKELYDALQRDKSRGISSERV